MRARANLIAKENLQIQFKKEKEKLSFPGKTEEKGNDKNIQRRNF